MKRLRRMAEAAHYGTRGKLAERIEKPLAKRTPLSRETLRSLSGALFLFWSARRVFRALRAGLSGRGARR